MQNKFTIRERCVGLAQSPYFVAQLGHEATATPAKTLEAMVRAAETGANAIEVNLDKTVGAERAAEICNKARALDLAVFAAHVGATDNLSEAAARADAHVLCFPSLADLEFVAKLAMLGQPLLICTEAAELPEIEQAVNAARDAGCTQLAVVHHVGTDASVEANANLHTLLDMSFRFDSVIGLADGSAGTAIAIAGVALGATIICKPLAEAAAYRSFVQDCRKAWQALGLITYALSDSERVTRARRSQPSDALAG